MSEAERDLKAKVFALVSDYIPTNEPRNAQLARLLGREMVNVRRQAFIEAAEIAGAYDTGGYGRQDNMAFCQEVSREISGLIRAKAEETQG